MITPVIIKKGTASNGKDKVGEINLCTNIYVGIPPSNTKKLRAPIAIENATGTLMHNKTKKIIIGKKII